MRGGPPGWAGPPRFGNPPLQLQNGGLQPHDDGDESSAVGGAPVDFGFHA